MGGNPSALAIMIPIVAIVMGIGVAFWAIYWDHRTKQMKYRERELMIEKGLTPPPLEPEKPRATLDECLQRGVIMIFLGIGLGIGYFVLLHSWGPPAWICGVGAAIVELLGIGNIVYYAIAKKSKNESSQNTGSISIP
ncbi:MAG TPA: DUF6249 domain-containing protein [Acidobacteriota bacterium]|nr:DUF6249 domain-containing protein [Acidobacteriota bacterium]